MASSGSNFTSLLRRSKFARFDPTIDQVYTSAGGHLHRQDFGLKRPLPANNSKFIRVTAIDSPQRQTEFSPSSREALFLKKWDESGYGASQYVGGLSETVLVEHEVDSWFDRDSESSKAPIKAREVSLNPTDIKRPNYLSMSEKEFTKFLEELRELRPKFKAFLEEEEKRRLAQSKRRHVQAGGQAEAQLESGSTADAVSGSEAEVDLYEHAQDPSKGHGQILEDFLRWLARERGSQKSYEGVEPQPHRTLGLSYHLPDSLYNQRLSDSVPGRALFQESGRQRLNADVVATSFIGHVADLRRNSSDGIAMTQFYPDVEGYRDSKRGEGRFRVTTAKVDIGLPLQSQRKRFDSYDTYTAGQDEGVAITTGGRTSLLDKDPMPLSINLRSATASDNNPELNRHRPGSREYIAADVRKRTTSRAGLDLMAEGMKVSSRAAAARDQSPSWNAGSPGGRDRSWQRFTNTRSSTGRENPAGKDRPKKGDKSLLDRLEELRSRAGSDQGPK